jgi:hypothetical protein
MINDKTEDIAGNIQWHPDFIATSEEITTENCVMTSLTPEIIAVDGLSVKGLKKGVGEIEIEYLVPRDLWEGMINRVPAIHKAVVQVVVVDEIVGNAPVVIVGGQINVNSVYESFGDYTTNHVIAGYTVINVGDKPITGFRITRTFYFADGTDGVVGGGEERVPDDFDYGFGRTGGFSYHDSFPLAPGDSASFYGELPWSKQTVGAEYVITAYGYFNGETGTEDVEWVTIPEDGEEWVSIPEEQRVGFTDFAITVE